MASMVVDSSSSASGEHEVGSQQQAPVNLEEASCNPGDSSLLVENKMKRSKVWDHFKEYEKIVKGKDSEGNPIDIVEKRAYCIHCPRGKKGDFSVNGGKYGTSGMIRHMQRYCRYIPTQHSKDQKLLGGDRSKGNIMVAVGYNEDDYIEAIIEMIVIDELPFSIVEKKGFRKLLARICPLFTPLPSRRKIVTRLHKMFDAQKKELQKTLKSYRVCLTTDTWTSVQNINYMVLTAHFIDHDWKMHKRVINFCVIQNHQGATIGRLIDSCLSQWGIEKVLTITMDNASANKSAIEWLKMKMTDSAAHQCILECKYMHVRCTAHICNLIVGHGLKRLQKSVSAIRNAVKYVRSSPNRLDSFKKSVVIEKLGTTGLVCLDVPTRWNSTYLMLEAAIKYKRAFLRMEGEEDQLFVNYFKEAEEEFDEDGNITVSTSNKKGKVGPPTKSDWDMAEVLVDILQVFYDITLRVSASLHPSVHTTFHDILTIENNINSLFVRPEIATGAETERIVNDMAHNMSSRFLKYFGSFTDMNHLIVVGLVLDPRFKLRNYTHCLREIELPEEDVQRQTKDIHSLLMALYNEYASEVDGGIYMRKQEGHAGLGSSSTITSSINRCKNGARAKMINNWKNVVQVNEGALVLHEVDQYLAAPCEFLRDDEDDFDILCWWKINGPKFPVLAAIARDVLAIQTSTVSSESCFSTGGRVISAFRSSLTAQSVEELVCMQNWLLGDEIGEVYDDLPSIENTQFYESVELDHQSNASSKNICSSVQHSQNRRGKQTQQLK